MFLMTLTGIESVFFAGFYLILRVFWIEPSFTGFQRVSFGFTGFYLVLQVPICAYGFRMFCYGV